VHPLKKYLTIYDILYIFPPFVFSRVRVARSLVLHVCFVDRCLSFCPFSVGLNPVGQTEYLRLSNTKLVDEPGYLRFSNTKLHGSNRVLKIEQHLIHPRGFVLLNLMYAGSPTGFCVAQS
jgi:hypothetical protein